MKLLFVYSHNLYSLNDGNIINGIGVSKEDAILKKSSNKRGDIPVKVNGFGTADRILCTAKIGNVQTSLNDAINLQTAGECKEGQQL